MAQLDKGDNILFHSCGIAILKRFYDSIELLVAYL
jgi:hypothetical protein